MSDASQNNNFNDGGAGPPPPETHPTHQTFSMRVTPYTLSKRDILFGAEVFYTAPDGTTQRDVVVAFRNGEWAGYAEIEPVGVGRPQGTITIRYRTFEGENEVYHRNLANEPHLWEWSPSVWTLDPVIDIIAGPIYEFPGLRTAYRLGHDIVVVWDAPPHAQDYTPFIIEVSETEEGLSSPEALRINIDDPHARFHVIPNYPNASYVRVRALNAGSIAQRHEWVGHYSTPTGPATVNGLELTLEPPNPYTNDYIAFSAKVDIEGDGDAGVNWSVSGADPIETTDTIFYGRLLEGTVTVTATSKEDPSTSDTLTFEVQDALDDFPGHPSPPQNIRITNLDDGTRALAEWNAPSGQPPAAGYWLYLSQQQSTLLLQHPEHLTTRRTVLRDLVPGEEYWLLVRSISAQGTLDNQSPNDAISFVAGPGGSLPIGLRTSPLRSLRVGSGGNTSVDLGNHLWLAPTETEETQFELWQSIDVDVHVIGNTAQASSNESTLSISVPPSVVPGDEPALILVRLSRPGMIPVWCGLVISAGPVGSGVQTGAFSYEALHFNALSEQPQFSLLHYQWAESVFYSSWQAEFFQLARALPVSISWRRGANALARADLVGTNESPLPQVAVVHGDAGPQVIIIGRDPSPVIVESTPLFPSGVEDIERADETWEDVFESFQAAVLSPSTIKPSKWRRAFTGNDLFDISLYAPPEQLHYAAPLFWQEHWFDEYLFPEDASLQTEENGARVEYRGGLQSPFSTPSLPTVADFQHSFDENEVLLTWELKHPITQQTLRIPATVEINPLGSSQTLTVSGIGRVRLAGLEPNTVYEARILNQGPITFRTPRPIVRAHVVGTVLAENHYRYKYTLQNTEAMIEWEDAFGNTHTDTEFELETDEQVGRHTIVITFPESTQTRNVDTDWTLPAPGVSFSTEIEMGKAISVQGLDHPTFYYNAYEGERSVDLGYNVFREGALYTALEGHLPLGLTGSLEDYCEVAFYDDTGQDLGPETRINVPTELGLIIKVRANDGLSPIVYGVRVHRRPLTA